MSPRAARVFPPDKNARRLAAADPQAAYRLRLEQALALIEAPVPSPGRYPLAGVSQRRNRLDYAVAQARAALRRALELAG